MIRPHGSARFVRLSDPRRQYLELQDELDDAIAGVLRRGVFTPDEQVDAFEADVAAWMGLPHAVGVGSGSSALMLTLRALGVGRGDEVAVTANLDISAVSPISQLGAHPLWIDIDPRTHNMSPVDLESRLTPQTRAALPSTRCSERLATRGILPSTGGGAAALASGEVWLAHGSDHGGSLRRPATYCSVVGLRPSPGRVTRGTVDTLFSPLSVQGPMARSVPDVANLTSGHGGGHMDPIPSPQSRHGRHPQMHPL